MPSFGEELQLTFFDDNSFCINQWPHLVYRMDIDEIDERSSLAKKPNKKKFHAKYLEEGLKEKKKLRERVALLLKLLGGNQG